MDPDPLWQLLLTTRMLVAAWWSANGLTVLALLLAVLATLLAAALVQTRRALRAVQRGSLEATVAAAIAAMDRVCAEAAARQRALIAQTETEMVRLLQERHGGERRM